jgi:hypothetical protein
MTRITRRELVVGASVLAAAGPLQACAQPVAPAVTPEPMRPFRPGEVWLDTTGNPIQAHGGSIIVVGDDFYWYGENKEKTNGDGKVYTWGARCYVSKDLYNWDDLGLIIPPDTEDHNSPLHPTPGFDRPHILYNDATKKFVCWIKDRDADWVTRTALTADKITGPYTIVRSGVRPFGMGAGDFDLVICPEDRKAYMYFERVHRELICADLTDDYTAFTGYYSTHFPRRGPPLVREGPAYFWRNGKHYLATSGTTGYFPNPSEIATADTYHGPWTVLGDLHPNDRSRTSFNSQISCVFRHPQKKDLYIALADRWMGPLSGPEFESGEMSRQVQALYAKMFTGPDGPREQMPPDEIKRLTPEDIRLSTYLSSPLATAQSRYVWLPIRFDDERPVIEWRDQWSLDEFI